jgi:hypothetical protein
MSHYAKVLNGIVQQVIVAEEDFFTTFVDTSPGTWIKTSYNTRGGVHYDPVTNEPDGKEPLRGNYAGVGFVYDQANDVFYPSRPVDMRNIPCASWTIGSPTWTWTPPTPYPDDGKRYQWDESGKVWVEITA